MNVVLEVIDTVGPMKLWPSYILEMIFCERLSPISRVTISAFMYGHGVHLFLVNQFLNVCSPLYSGEDGASVGHWYALWAESFLERRRRTYFNVRSGMVFDLNQDISRYTLNPSVRRNLMYARKLSDECLDLINGRLAYLGLPVLSSKQQGEYASNRTPKHHRDPNDPELRFLLSGVFDEDW